MGMSKRDRHRQKHPTGGVNSPVKISRDPAWIAYQLFFIGLIAWGFVCYKNQRIFLSALLFTLTFAAIWFVVASFLLDVGPWRRIRAVYDCGSHLLLECRKCNYCVCKEDIYSVVHVYSYRGPDFCKIYLKPDSDISNKFVHMLDDWFKFYCKDYNAWPNLQFSAWLHLQAEALREATNPFKNRQ